MYTGQTVFSQLMDFLPMYEFRKCVDRYGGNYHTSSFSCMDQYLCMGFAQLTYRESLRDIEACLRSRKEKLYHLGIRGRVWEQVSDWIDRNGSISNRELCRIAGIETLKASKMLKKWVDADMLVPDTSKGKRGTKYMRVGGGYVHQYISLSELTDNKRTDDE